MNINEAVKKLAKEFKSHTYRIKDKNGVVLKFVKNGVTMEVQSEIKKNTSCNGQK